MLAVISLFITASRNAKLAGLDAKFRKIQSSRVGPLFWGNLWVKFNLTISSLKVLGQFQYRAGVGKVRPAGQIRPASSVHPARGGSSVLTLNSARKTYRTMSDCFHAERDLVAHQ